MWIYLQEMAECRCLMALTWMWVAKDFLKCTQCHANYTKESENNRIIVCCKRFSEVKCIEWAMLPGQCSTLWGSLSPARIFLVLLPQRSLQCLSWKAGWSYTGCLASGCRHIFAKCLLEKHTAHVVAILFAGYWLLFRNVGVGIIKKNQPNATRISLLSLNVLDKWPELNISLTIIQPDDIHA